MFKGVPVQKISLLDLAKQVSGREDVKGVSFMKDGNVEFTEYFYGESSDLLPSVSFSLSDVISDGSDFSYADQDFIDSITVKKFPGLV